MMRIRFSWGKVSATAIVALGGVGMPLAAWASSTGVTGEAVDHYHGAASDIICIQEMDNFRNGVLNAPGTIFTAGGRWVDDDVWDVDFHDPDASGLNTDGDNNAFDIPGDGVSFVSVHGNTNTLTNQSCTSHTQCNSPLAGQSLPGACIGNPPGTSGGWCAYIAPRNGYVGPHANNQRNGNITYTDGTVKFGESTNAGTWGGAGTNGGINFAAFVSSYTVGPNDIYEALTPMFAGMTILGVVMPITPQSADDWDAPARGTALANAHKTNPNGSVGEAWVNSIVGVPANAGGACGNSGGGGHGVDKCGAQVAVSVDINSADAFWDRDTETWNQVINDGFDSAGFGWWTYRWTCNYNCNSANWNL